MLNIYLIAYYYHHQPICHDHHPLPPKIHIQSRQLLILNPNPNPNPNPCPISNVQRGSNLRWSNPEKKCLSILILALELLAHLVKKNLRWKFGDHWRPPSTRPPSSCRTPSASSTPWPHGSALPSLFWSLSNPPPPPSQLIFLTRILHCLSFKKVCFSTYSLATPMSLRCRGSH